MKFEYSPNFSSRHGKKISHLILHVTEGNYPGCKEWLKNPKSGVSSHYVISRGGEIVQLVHDKDKSWATMNANPFVLNLEHEGFSDNRKAITQEQWDASIKLSAELCKTYKVPVKNILGHNDPWLRQFKNNHSDPGSYINMIKYREDVAKAML